MVTDSSHFYDYSSSFANRVTRLHSPLLCPADIAFVPDCMKEIGLNEVKN